MKRNHPHITLKFQPTWLRKAVIVTWSVIYLIISSGCMELLPELSHNLSHAWHATEMMHDHHHNHITLIDKHTAPATDHVDHNHGSWFDLLSAMAEKEQHKPVSTQETLSWKNLFKTTSSVASPACLRLMAGYPLPQGIGMPDELTYSPLSPPPRS